MKWFAGSEKGAIFVVDQNKTYSIMKKNFALSALAVIVAVAFVFTGCKDSEPDPVKVSSITVSPATETLEIGGTVTLTAAVLPADADNKLYTWSSSDDAKASVSKAGVVTAKAAGRVTITATASDGSNAKGTATITINEAVVPPATVVAFASGLSLSDVNSFNYSEIVTAEGAPAKDLSVEVSSQSIGNITIKLITDNELIGSNLPTGVAEGIALGGPVNLELAAILDAIFNGGLPFGDNVVGKQQVELDFSAIQPLIASIPGGVNQFDIEIKAEDADSSVVSVTKTLKLKFVDDVTVWGAIAGDGFDIDEEQVINISGAASESRKIDITSLTGIEKLLVNIENPMIDAITGGLPELDLATPGNNAALLRTIAGMGLVLPSGDAVKGKTALTIDMDAAFIGALVGLGEDTTVIKLTVEDAAGHAVTKTLTITIVNDLSLQITGSVGETPIEIKMSDALADPIAIDPVAVDIVADQGIKNFMVEIDSSSIAFKTALGLFHVTGAFDLANPGEDLAGSLTTVGLLDPETPIKDATELRFDVTQFIPLIFQVRNQMSQETGDFTASFRLIVTDGANQTKSATIALDLVDDSAAQGGE